MNSGAIYLVCDMENGLIAEGMPFFEEAKRRNVIANTKRAIENARAAGIAKPLFTRTAELRFLGQGFEVPATVPSGDLRDSAIVEIKANFAASYERLYRSLPGDLPLEALT
jgi:hypothetical protein